jgi:glycosyltransferase involved in cell wall biosynthesis
MRFSAHTYVTNPLSTGYLIYLPAVQSFLDFADEVVVVDGGSTDGSLEALARLRGHERLVVVSNEQTRWGAGDSWERPQFGIQRQTGFERCTGDWAIAFDADHVLPDAEHDSLKHQLEQRAQRDVLLGFKLIECQDGHCRPIGKRKWWCINKRLAETRSARIGYGIKEDTGGNERPIRLARRKSFVDPVTGIDKHYFAGPAFPEDGVLDANLYKYDHFFFKPDQLLTKLRRFESMRARWEGRQVREVEADPRPFERVEPQRYLAERSHPRAFHEFLASWELTTSEADRDIVGLRRRTEEPAPGLRGTIRRLLGRRGE